MKIKALVLSSVFLFTSSCSMLNPLKLSSLPKINSQIGGEKQLKISGLDQRVSKNHGIMAKTQTQVENAKTVNFNYKMNELASKQQRTYWLVILLLFVLVLIFMNLEPPRILIKKLLKRVKKKKD